MSIQNLTGFAKGDMENGRKTGASQVEVGNRRGKTDKSRRAGVCVLTAIAVVLLIFPVVTIPILFTIYAKLSSRQVISYDQLFFTRRFHFLIKPTIHMFIRATLKELHMSRQLLPHSPPLSMHPSLL
jgi:hypothetical protein